MIMFFIGVLVTWLLIGSLILLNDSFSLHGGIELFDGWLVIFVCFPCLIILCPLIIIKHFLIKRKRSKKDNE